MLLLVISPKGDVFQGWKELIKEKGDGGSQPLLTACCQFREKWNELSELKGSVRGRRVCSSLCAFFLEPQEDILMVQLSERWILWCSEHIAKRQIPPFAAKPLCEWCPCNDKSYKTTCVQRLTSPQNLYHWCWVISCPLAGSECSTGPSLTIAF